MVIKREEVGDLCNGCRFMERLVAGLLGVGVDSLQWEDALDIGGCPHGCGAIVVDDDQAVTLGRVVPGGVYTQVAPWETTANYVQYAHYWPVNWPTDHLDKVLSEKWGGAV